MSTINSLCLESIPVRTELSCRFHLDLDLESRNLDLDSRILDLEKKSRESRSRLFSILI